MKKINKKANWQGTIVVILIAVLVLGLGVWTRGFGLFPEEEIVTEEKIEKQVAAAKAGDISSYKLSAEDNSDNPTRYAATAYVWNTATPTKLKGGGSLTLSATTATTIPSTTVGESLTAVAFDSTHYGIETVLDLKGESDEDTLKTLNASSTNEIFLFEDGTKEIGSPDLTIAAGATDTFDKWTYKANVADKGINLKGVCFGRNMTGDTSEIVSIKLDGFSTMTRPYRGRNTYTFCQQLPIAIYIEDYATEIFGSIKIEMSSGFTATRETVNMTLIDEAYFESIDGSIQLGIETDSPSPADVGLADVVIAFNITKG